MEENYRWISAVLVDSGEHILVRQSGVCSPVWEDESGNVYTYSDLDFTKNPEEPSFMKDFNERMQKQNEEHEKTQNQLREMLSAMDARAIADHQAKIDESAYWRKLRGEIFAKIMERGGEFVKESELDWAVRCTRFVFDRLYKQHQDFLNENNLNNN